MVRDHAELVQQQRVRAAERVRGIEILARQRHVVQLQVLHAQKERGQVGALEEAGGGGVGRYRLVVLALGGKGVREADPGGAKVGVHHGGLGEVAARLCHAPDGEVVDADGQPRGGLVRVAVGEIVREQEECVGLVQFVQAGEVHRQGGEVVALAREDPGG